MPANSSILPPTMRAWLWTKTAGGLEKNLHLSESAIRPGQHLGKDHVLIQIISMSLNPADLRLPELGLLARLLVSTPACPGLDFCGRLVHVGSNVKDFTAGQIVFGCLGFPIQFGPLAEYMVCSSHLIVPLPEGVDPDDAASLGVAAQTAYQVVKPPSQPGDRIFINGGSGGCGLFCIQIAKILGWYVTVTCSAKNIALCKELGADEVIDYMAVDLIQILKEEGQVFDLVVDNVGKPNLYRQSHHFLRAGRTYSQVNVESILSAIDLFLRPAFLGGGKRKLDLYFLATRQDQLIQLGKWVQEGKLKVVIDSIFEFEEAVKAYEKLGTHRARGKIVVRVSKKP